MGRQIIKQPNGKYGIWDSHENDFIYLNCTPEDIIDIYCQEYREEIVAKVTQQIERLEKGNKLYFTKSWDDALSCIKDVHGKEKLVNFKEELKELGIEK